MMATYQDTAVDNPKGLALLLPGKAYPTQMPQLYFAKQVALAAGYNVRELAWDPGMEWSVPAITAEVEKALEGNDLPLVIFAKSIGSLSSVYAAEHSVRSVWITPTLDTPEVIEAIGANTAAQFAFGGTEDGYWNSEAASTWPENVRVLEFPGADHSLLVAGNPARGAAIVGEYTTAMVEFASENL
ncbi:hypothetical protein J2S49_001623 [Arcanobacterium wilhelmae]|uniref:Alpha/beta hydrolase n=1 Tax=Arcanobacterium wilhelmae TaxID=1803177 RepID=A0ABT9NCV0_9ACTO|nr:hypothetical protein [Arcanobacterium wilhelmae]MDP9801547.1 hypothetical protein [Arcanobacterium wilhelmae]WFN90874.1 hypothetical protein P8A24_03195 [Arcanobacterium wilhelmae]